MLRKPAGVARVVRHGRRASLRSRTRARRCCKASTRSATRYADVAKQIWGFAEVGYQETKSSALLQQQLRAAGFTVQRRRRRHADRVRRDVRLRQAGDRHRRRVRRAARAVAGGATRGAQADRGRTAPGHGCGHNLLGTGALAAAIAVKEWLAAHGHSRHAALLRHAGRGRRLGQGLHGARRPVQRRRRRGDVASRRSQRGEPDELDSRTSPASSASTASRRTRRRRPTAAARRSTRSRRWTTWST